ncbi:MAG: formyltetrahydrofolate deformylase [Flavobacteriia bacterium]|nr:formyltetrahydrofolate deformylase [Flavobacteriia bacterium]OIP47278.1 MAG: formyltetrahydrofolate deformylase [Flavobacteriaceae bacterium CG2_30_31_66]PIV96139.1 MAG: formyltetrahydrofolate deformylase [Flavobacteriaceae bacterium CG17_big_fil_post_rev_8_21_14_2_50_31_13]PIX13815.1 MAG: formyltetrahydrofolate deformylase [Flavobacteriaceae bacterium CG_4_8_14_3_um_filter_31_8]PIY14356.1 MAG: formyltetrahydrofolate deformylase [Flavobacteriaceae bacterium CG_4_10_14_3_um_filter_31_253]PIZ
MKSQIVTFLIQCPDQKGLVAKITNFFFEKGFNILSCQQYVNSIENTYFMRIRLNADGTEISKKDLEHSFLELATPLHFKWSVHYGDKKQQVAILVSHTSHNLYDLLERFKEGNLNCTVKMIISNHEKLKPIAAMFQVPFYYVPVIVNDKSKQEKQLKELLDGHQIDLIILARYMQILSSNFINSYPEKIINIHHSFLPAFQGANPYKRAYERGVKLIGATAHYATEDLDEGPIIEQDVKPVTHESTPITLKRIGADIEKLVLARAVNSHLNNQIIVSGKRAIIFPETGE